MLNDSSTQAPNYLLTGVFRAQYFVALKVLAYIWPVIILFGIVSNSINIVVFFKAVPKDSVTILLLSLAGSDLSFLMLITPTICGFVAEGIFRPKWTFDVTILFFLLYWPAQTAYDVSAFFSVSLGMTRCACVTMPLKFKSVFTKSRTIKWVLFVTGFAICLRIPVFTFNRLVRRQNLITNTTQLYLLRANYYEAMKDVSDILNKSIMMYLALIIMIVCVVLLSFKLYEASKVRRSSAPRATLNSNSQPEKSSTQKLSARDLQVVQSVTLVCVIFILSQLPYMIISIIRLFDPEFDDEKAKHHYYGFANQLALTCSYLNASLNIFVYYKYNSKYKATFQALFCGKPGVK